VSAWELHRHRFPRGYGQLGFGINPQGDIVDLYVVDLYIQAVLTMASYSPV
jgi:hypothetical protein